MIDLIQWRTSIGLWNGIKSFKRESGDRRGEEILQIKLTLLLIIVLVVILFITVIFNCPETGVISQMSCSGDKTARWVWSMTNCAEVVIFSYFFYFLLLLSGDVELNPGPTLDDRPSFRLLLEWLKPLVDWQSFGIHLPGIERDDIEKIELENKLIEHQKQSFFSKLLDVNSKGTITWQHVIDALKKEKAFRLAHNITRHLQSKDGQPIEEDIIPVIPIPNETPPISSFDDVQRYADIIKDRCNRQPIVATDWPPRVGKDFFGRLALIETQDYFQQHDTAWNMLRGKVDEIPKLTGHKEILIEDILKPCSSPPTVVVDGPPGIGKTTLCRKLCNMWANGTLTQYDLVLYCPLRNSKIAQATTLVDLFEYLSPNKIPNVIEWMTESEGQGLLFIFDGWDELSTELRRSSLATSIIRRDQLAMCSIIVTSRSYASSSLLKITSFSRHVQVIGFTEKEIEAVVKGTLKDNDSQLADKLNTDLKVRNDVQSLCYLPLICSMVILVYRKLGGQLPTTLTQLYENFILQTIRRHVDKSPTRSSIEPRQLYSLDNLPPVLATPLQEMSRFAYLNLRDNKMTFSSHQLPLNNSSKENYLGLLTTFIQYDEEIHQFLHLSIQEFLAAWWIVKNEGLQTEEVFHEHFANDHFQMCLRFIAGLTHLKPEESYEHYFTKQVDLPCKIRPLFGFKGYRNSWFYQNLEFKAFNPNDHIIYNPDEHQLPIYLIHLLYESQSKVLCQTLAKSIKNHSLCLAKQRLSPFDKLCLFFFIDNSNTSWNYLDFDSHFIYDQIPSLHQSKVLKMILIGPAVHKIAQSLRQTPSLYSLQECYCELYQGECDPCLVLLAFLNVPQLRILHMTLAYFIITEQDSKENVEKYSEIEKCLEFNSSIQEMNFVSKNLTDVKLVASICKGVTKNKIMKSFEVTVSYTDYPLPDGIIEHLLKDNDTLQALTLNMDEECLPELLNITEVNVPLTALEIGGRYSSSSSSSRLIRPILLHIKELHCLTLHNELHCPLPSLFHSHLCLQSLSISMNTVTVEGVTELFTILQTNTTLKGLRMSIEGVPDIFTSDRVCNSLQEMLVLNQTLQFFEIKVVLVSNCEIPSSYLTYLTTGLIHNVSIQQLRIPIPLGQSTEQLIRELFTVISEKSNLTEFQMDFVLDQVDQFYIHFNEVQMLMYEQLLPTVITLLQSHTTIRLLRIEFQQGLVFYPSILTEIVQNFYKTIFIHPSLEYVGLWIDRYFYHTFKAQEEALIDIHRQQQPLRPLPILEITF